MELAQAREELQEAEQEYTAIYAAISGMEADAKAAASSTSGRQSLRVTVHAADAPEERAVAMRVEPASSVEGEALQAVTYDQPTEFMVTASDLLSLIFTVRSESAAAPGAGDPAAEGLAAAAAEAPMLNGNGTHHAEDGDEDDSKAAGAQPSAGQNGAEVPEIPETAEEEPAAVTENGLTAAADADAGEPAVEPVEEPAVDPAEEPVAEPAATVESHNGSPAPSSEAAVVATSEREVSVAASELKDGPLMDVSRSGVRFTVTLAPREEPVEEVDEEESAAAEAERQSQLLRLKLALEDASARRDQAKYIVSTLEAAYSGGGGGGGGGDTVVVSKPRSVGKPATSVRKSALRKPSVRPAPAPDRILTRLLVRPAAALFQRGSAAAATAWKAKNIIIFGTAVLLIHFKGDELAV